MGEVPLDSYTLDQCLAMSDAEKLKALEEMTEGTMTEIMIGTLDTALQKELNQCNSKYGKASSTTSLIANFLTMGLQPLMFEDEYTKDIGVANFLERTAKSGYKSMRQFTNESNCIDENNIHLIWQHVAPRSGIERGKEFIFS